MEGVLSKLMFDLPSEDKIAKAIITAGCVEGTESPKLIEGERKVLGEAKNALPEKRESRKKSSWMFLIEKKLQWNSIGVLCL